MKALTRLILTALLVGTTVGSAGCFVVLLKPLMDDDASSEAIPDEDGEEEEDAALAPRDWHPSADAGGAQTPPLKQIPTS